MSENTAARPAICARCRHLSLNGMGQRHWLWTCMQNPRPQKMNYQTGEMVADPAYYYAKDCNPAGECEQFEEGPSPINPRIMEEPKNDQ